MLDLERIVDSENNQLDSIKSWNSRLIEIDNWFWEKLEPLSISKMQSAHFKWMQELIDKMKQIWTKSGTGMGDGFSLVSNWYYFNDNVSKNDLHNVFDSIGWDEVHLIHYVEVSFEAISHVVEEMNVDVLTWLGIDANSDWRLAISRGVTKWTAWEESR